MIIAIAIVIMMYATTITVIMTTTYCTQVEIANREKGDWSSFTLVLLLAAEQ